MEIEKLNKLLLYDSNSGVLFWRFRDSQFYKTKDGGKNWNKRYAGKVAGSINKHHKYVELSVLGRRLYAHRVAWALYYGHWPKYNIDHINGDRSDNRICNLRDIPQLENCRNSPIRRNNTSGTVGVSWSSLINKWWANIWVEGKLVNLGYFKDKQEAIKTRKEAEKLYGFHENHGRILNGDH